jgi:transposase-like protein
MKAKRKRHSAAFKAKVGFEALVGLKTVSQLAREYAVHPTQVTQWRATIRDHMPELFEVLPICPTSGSLFYTYVFRSFHHPI